MKQMLLRLVSNKENIGYKEIAKLMTTAFGVTFTKNACIGMGRRLKLGPRPVKVRKKKMTKFPQRVDAPIAAEIDPRKEGFNLTIYQLREGDCKFPLAEVKDYPPYMFCGKPALLGSSWCKACSGKVFNRISVGTAKTARLGW